MSQGHRPDRVGEEIRHELSELLSRGAVHDPGIGFITLTRVKVSPDLQQARVFYTSLGDDKARTETARALERATPFLRRQMIGMQVAERKGMILRVDARERRAAEHEADVVVRHIGRNAAPQ